MRVYVNPRRPKKLCEICFKKPAKILFDRASELDYWGRPQLKVYEVCEGCKAKVEAGEAV